MGTQRPENGGGIQGGRPPLLAHDFRRKSSVLYLLSRLARERGGAVWRSHFPAPGNQAAGWSAAIIPLPDFGRGKRYISPRPSSLVPPQRHRQRTNFPICEPPVRVRVQDRLLAARIICFRQIFKERNQPAPELCQLLLIDSIAHCM